jgi:hypothetical protein
MPAAIADQIYFIFLQRTYNAHLERLEPVGSAGENGVDEALKALGR